MGHEKAQNGQKGKLSMRAVQPDNAAPVNPRDYRAAISIKSSGIESKAIDAESLIQNIGLFKPPR